MAKIALNTTLGNSASPSFVTAINSNFTKLQDAINNGVLWRFNPDTGQASMSVDLNINGHSLLNAYVDGKSLIEIKNTAYKGLESVEASKAWAEVAGQYAASANDAELGAIEQLELTKAQVQISASNTLAAKQQADRATQQANNIASSAAAIAANTSQLSALASTVASNKAGTDSTISANKTSAEAAIASLTAAVTSNKTSADATASSLSVLNTTVLANKASADSTAATLSTLSSTVSANKTSADATATALTALTTRVTTEETKVQSVALGGTGATTASAARTALGVGYTASASSTQQVYYFDNGMMLMHYTVTGPAIAASSSSAHSWTFPVAFAQPPYVNVRAVSGNSAAFLATFESESTTSASGYLVNNSGSSVTPVLHYFAFGVKA